MNNILNPTFGANTIASVLLKYNYKVKTGDILAGNVIAIERKHTVINVGLKQVAFLPNQEIVINPDINKIKILRPNEIGEFLILYYDSKTDKTIVSLRRLHFLRLWERFKQIDFKNMTLFTDFHKNFWGGKLVNFDGLKIFIPNSHLPKYYRRKKTLYNSLAMKILEVKDKRYQIIGSSRLAFLKKQSGSLQVGMIQKGCVIAVKPFGIFLNIYGIKCLLHISEISNKKIENLMLLYKKGDKITVKVIYVNSSQGKIALSTKQVLS
jgi:small subunit ribosomal protein S1